MTLKNEDIGIGKRVSFKISPGAKPEYGTIHEIQGHLIRVFFDKHKNSKNYKGSMVHKNSLEVV